MFIKKEEIYELCKVEKEFLNIGFEGMDLLLKEFVLIIGVVLLVRRCIKNEKEL